MINRRAFMFLPAALAAPASLAIPAVDVAFVPDVSGKIQPLLIGNAATPEVFNGVYPQGEPKLKYSWNLSDADIALIDKANPGAQTWRAVT